MIIMIIQMFTPTNMSLTFLFHLRLTPLSLLGLQVRTSNLRENYFKIIFVTLLAPTGALIVTVIYYIYIRSHFLRF